MPPPRTIKDITAILDQQTIADPEESARLVAKADEVPPATGEDSTLASFYYARGKAADVVGRQQQYVEDLRTALRFAEKTASVNPMLWSHGDPRSGPSPIPRTEVPPATGEDSTLASFWIMPVARRRTWSGLRALRRNAVE